MAAVEWEYHQMTDSNNEILTDSDNEVTNICTYNRRSPSTENTMNISAFGCTCHKKSVLERTEQRCVVCNYDSTIWLLDSKCRREELVLDLDQNVE